KLECRIHARRAPSRPPAVERSALELVKGSLKSNTGRIRTKVSDGYMNLARTIAAAASSPWRHSYRTFRTVRSVYEPGEAQIARRRSWYCLRLSPCLPP